LCLDDRIARYFDAIGKSAVREFAKISPQFWISERGREIKRLGIKAQLITFYLFTNPHSSMIGIYYLPIAFIAHETGIQCNDVIPTLKILSEINLCSYDEKSEYIWVHDMAFEQIGTELKHTDNRVKGVHDAFYALPNLPFLNSFLEKYAEPFHMAKFKTKEIILFEGSSEPLQSKEKEKEKKNEKEKEKEMLISCKPDVDSICEDDCIFNEKKPFSAKDQMPLSLKSQALEVLQFLNEKTGRAYRPVDSNLKLIISRLKTGASVMDCRQVIAKKNREWRDDPKMSEYLRPATLFNAIKFEQYMGELVLPKEEEVHES
jgi:uncharacterized phage protein (TIGR02220 family)